MGRTVPSFRQVIESEFEAINKFKKGLRKRDREALEDLLYRARLHSQAGAYGNFLDPMHVILIGMILEQEKKLRKLDEGNVD